MLLAREVERLIVHLEPILDGHRVEVDIDARLLVLAERRALRAVLSNLLVTSARHSPSGLPTMLFAERAGREVTVTVHNEGNGVVPEEVRGILERGERVTHNGRSSNVGLSVARELVVELGGRIWAEVEPDATSYRFTLRAPPG
jgi:signal transduction histidine kinase